MPIGDKSQVVFEGAAGPLLVAPTNPLPVVLYGTNGAVLLGNPVAAADDMANPTAPQMLAYEFGYDGATWDRMLGGTGAAAGSRIIVPLFGAALTDGATNSPAALTNSTGTNRMLAIMSYRFNGTNYDREYNNTEGTAIASAARTATNNSADIINYNGRALIAVLNVTVAGTGSVTLSIQGKDPVSAAYYTILAGAAVTTVSTNVYVVGLGITETANVDVAFPLPRTFRVLITHNNANSITYSVGYTICV